MYSAWQQRRGIGLRRRQPSSRRQKPGLTCWSYVCRQPTTDLGEVRRLKLKLIVCPVTTSRSEAGCRADLQSDQGQRSSRLYERPQTHPAVLALGRQAVLAQPALYLQPEIGPTHRWSRRLKGFMRTGPARRSCDSAASSHELGFRGSQRSSPTGGHRLAAMSSWRPSNPFVQRDQRPHTGRSHHL